MFFSKVRYTLSILCACILVLQLFTYAFCFSKEEIDDCLLRGNNHLLRGEVDQAISEFTQAIKIVREIKPDASYAQAYYSRAVAYEYKGDLENAVSDYTEAIKLDPRNFLSYYRRGDIYQKTGRLFEAMSDYSSIIEIDQNQAHAYNNRGIVYGLMGDSDKALKEYDKALKISPKIINVHFNCGLAYLNKKDYFQAMNEFAKELEISPSSFNAKHYHLATSYFFNKEYDKSWDEAHILQGGGYKVSPIFIEELKKASGGEKESGSNFNKEL